MPQPHRIASDASIALLEASLGIRVKIGFHFWQNEFGLKPTNAFESFVDVDGQFVLDRIRGLAKTALERRCPMLFQ